MRSPTASARARKAGLPDGVDGLDGGDARQRVAGVGPAEAARVGGVHQLGPTGDGGQRHPRGQGLGRGHHVGDHAGVLDGEQLAGPTEPGLDLVGDQDHAVLVAQLPQPLQERSRGGDEPPLAQDRLDDDGGHVGRVDLGHHRPVQLADGVGHPLVLAERAGPAVEVGERQPVDLRGEGGEALLEQPELAGHGQGQVRPAVVRPLEDDHALAAGGVAGDADRGLDRLGPRVAEQGALVEVPRRDLVEPFGDVEVGLGGGHDVADVDEVGGLVLHGRRRRRAGM